MKLATNVFLMGMFVSLCVQIAPIFAMEDGRPAAQGLAAMLRVNFDSPPVLSGDQQEEQVADREAVLQRLVQDAAWFFQEGAAERLQRAFNAASVQPDRRVPDVAMVQRILGEDVVDFLNGEARFLAESNADAVRREREIAAGLDRGEGPGPRAADDQQTREAENGVLVTNYTFNRANLGEMRVWLAGWFGYLAQKQQEALRQLPLLAESVLLTTQNIRAVRDTLRDFKHEQGLLSQRLGGVETGVVFAVNNLNVKNCSPDGAPAGFAAAMSRLLSRMSTTLENIARSQETLDHRVTAVEITQAARTDDAQADGPADSADGKSEADRANLALQMQALRSGVVHETVVQLSAVNEWNHLCSPFAYVTTAAQKMRGDILASCGLLITAASYALKKSFSERTRRSLVVGRNVLGACVTVEAGRTAYSSYQTVQTLRAQGIEGAFTRQKSLLQPLYNKG